MHKDNWRIVTDIIVVKTRPTQGSECSDSMSLSPGVGLWAESALYDQNMYTASHHDGDLGIQKMGKLWNIPGPTQKRHTMMNVELRTLEMAEKFCHLPLIECLQRHHDRVQP